VPVGFGQGQRFPVRFCGEPRRPDVRYPHLDGAVSTRHGRVAAVIMSADDLDSLNETLHALRTPGIAEELAQADADYAAGNTVTGEEIRKRYGLK
jgi:Antitoxin Phd_YefM, type II toxin-antitoxin system